MECEGKPSVKDILDTLDFKLARIREHRPECDKYTDNELRGMLFAFQFLKHKLSE